MSKTNWAYPKDATIYKQDDVTYAYDSTGQEIKQLVEDAGYVFNGTCYEKNIDGFGVDTLNYKLTIAGGSTDHPAYSMFLNAARILNSVGFDVKVVTSQTALSDLSAGKLAIWAAAWSSTIDPDSTKSTTWIRKQVPQATGATSKSKQARIPRLTLKSIESSPSFPTSSTKVVPQPTKTKERASMLKLSTRLWNLQSKCRLIKETICPHTTRTCLTKAR